MLKAFPEGKSLLETSIMLGLDFKFGNVPYKDKLFVFYIIRRNIKRNLEINIYNSITLIRF